MIYSYMCVYASIFACFVASHLIYMYYCYVYLMTPPIERTGREPPPHVDSIRGVFFGYRRHWRGQI